MQLASVCLELSEMWNRSCFRMRALLVYATAPRKAGIPNFSTAEMVFDSSGLLCSPGTCSNWRQNCCFQREMHSRRGWLWRQFSAFCRRNRTAQRRVQKEAVLLVFSKPKRMQNGEVYNAAERRVCLLFLYKNYRLDISNMS